MRRLSALIQRPAAPAMACGLLVALTALPAYAQTCAPPPAGLIGWWPLNETTGTAVADALGQNSGTASGTIGQNGNPKSVPGLVGTGLNFYFGSRVTINANLNFGTTTNFTVDAWIKGQASPIVSNYSANKTGFSLFQDGIKLRLDMGNGTNVQAQWYGPAIDPNIWTFVAAVVDRTAKTVTLYTATAGNKLVSSGPLAITGNPNAGTTAPLIIGGCPGNPNGCNTVIDEVEIFNRALTQAELQPVVDAGSAGKCKPSGPAKGMTWRWGAVNATNGSVNVGCGASDPVHPCNASVGDQLCTDSLPLLCFKPFNPLLPVPKSVVETPYYNQWSGGIVATTPPVSPATSPISSSLANANARCEQEFGPTVGLPKWRLAEFHDGGRGAQSAGGWSFQAYGNVGDPKTRFWVHINDQPKGTCFTKP